LPRATEPIRSHSRPSPFTAGPPRMSNTPKACIDESRAKRPTSKLARRQVSPQPESAAQGSSDVRHGARTDLRQIPGRLELAGERASGKEWTEPATRSYGEAPAD